MENNHKNIKRSKRGAALISALMLLVILGIICSGFVQVIFKDSKYSKASVSDMVAFYTAEAGLEYGKWIIKHNLSYYPARTIYVRANNTDGDTSLKTFNKNDASTYKEILGGSIYNLWGTNQGYRNPASALTKSEINGSDASNPVRSWEYVYMSDLSFENDSASGRTNSLKRMRCLSSFSLTAAPLGADKGTFNYGTGSGSDVYPAQENGLPVGLASTGRIWAFPNSGSFANGINDYQTFLTNVSTSTLMDNGFELKGCRTVRCQFSHGCALAGQNGRSDAPADPSMTEFFTNYGEWFR